MSTPTYILKTKRNIDANIVTGIVVLRYNQVGVF